MFQASFIKRASKLATPATAVATLSTIGVASLSATLWQNQDDKDIQQLNNNASGIPVSGMQGGKVALCENNDKNNSVIGMLGDIKEKVRALYFINMRVLNCCVFFGMYVFVLSIIH